MEKNYLIIKQALKLKIKKWFNKYSSVRTLYIHIELLNLLNFCYGFKFHELLDGEEIVYFQDDTEATDVNKKSNNVIFCLFSIVEAMKTISSIILRNQANNINKTYHLCFIPKIDSLCVEELNRLNVAHKIQIESFDLGLVPLNKSLFSLQISPYCNELDIINLSVQSILKLSNMQGSFRNIVGKGEKSKMVLEILEKRQKQLSVKQNERQDVCLILFDRKIDMVTPMVTAHSYEALLDYFFGIELNKIFVPPHLLNKKSDKFEGYLLYNEKDPVYDKISYMNIEQAQNYVKNFSQKLKKQITERKSSAKNLDELEDIMKTLGVQFQQVQNHKAFIDFILNKLNQIPFYNMLNIEAEILTKMNTNLQDFHYLTLQYPIEHILRLICLYSQVYDGLSFYTKFEKQILEIVINNYDPKLIYSLYLLQKLKMIRNSKSKNKWEQISRVMDLIPFQPEKYTETHILYSALSIKFIEMVLAGRMDPETSILFGKQNYFKGKIDHSKNIKQLFVYFLGGVTYGELACIKILQESLKIKITVLTTNVSSGRKMIKSVLNSSEF